MSLDQANAFRDYVAQNDDVQKEIRSALMTEGAKVSEIAAKHGFTYTPLLKFNSYLASK